MDGSTKELCCPLQLASSNNPKPHNLIVATHCDRNPLCWILPSHNYTRERVEWVLVLALVLALALASLMDGSTKESCCPLQLAASSNPKPHNPIAVSHCDRNPFGWNLASYNYLLEWVAWVLVSVLVLVLASELATVAHHQQP